ncbi:MAG TPA: BON domain-containing protein [Acidobacteriota bacterium]|nr:BON domain-containing protein [Acidobacteriota bacterium]
MVKFRLLAAASLILLTAIGGLAQEQEKTKDEVIAADVSNVLERHVFYTVYDYLAFKLENGVVTLFGQVTADFKIESYKKSILKHVEAVKEVKSEIEILPPSATDDRIRYLIAYKIYNDDRMLRYAIANFPKPIHVIVRNGRVTLEGVVNTEMDRRLAESIAREVGGVLNVTNNLAVE